MPYICSNCAKDQHLKILIDQEGEIISACDICHSSNVKGLDCKNASLRSLFRALLRYHYSEWQYNIHMGGDGLEALFLKNNPITNYDKSWNINIYEEVLLEFLQNGYEPYDKGISLFAGYDDNGHQLMPLVAIKNDFDRSLVRLQRELINVNYFLLEKESRKIIEPYSNILERTFLAGSILYRSRVGFEIRATPLFGWSDDWHYKPYSSNNLSAPPPYLASGNRMNRQGVSFLYLSTNESTAVSEVRPHPGHFVSVGSFKCAKDLRVADFNAVSILDFCDSDKSLDNFVLLKSIDELFALPIIPEDRQKYSFTQFLADTIRHLEFDGIGYKSSVGEGTNYVFFDPGTFSYVEDSARVVRIQQLEYTHIPLTTMNQDEEYMTDQEGNYIQ